MGGCIGSLNGSGFSGMGHGACYSWLVEGKFTATNSCGTTILYRDITPRAPLPCEGSYKIAKTNNGKNNYRIIDPCQGASPYKTTETSPAQNYKIMVSNAMGNTIIQKDGNEFDLDAFPLGSYFVKVVKDGKVIVR